MSYRAGIVGLSSIAAGAPAPAPDPASGTAAPYSHAAAYALLPDVEVVAVCDLDAGRVADFQRRWGARWPGAATYGDFREMLAAERLDVLSVTTPDHFHRPVVALAAERGVRAICCEKPIATTLADADEMIDACARHGTLLSIDHTRRFVPHWQEARRLARAGEIGRVTQIQAVLGGPRSMVFRNGTHFIDLIGYFAEAAPEWVVAELEPELAAYGTAYAGDGGHDPRTDPGLNCYVAYRNGVRAYYCGMKDIPATGEVTVMGTGGFMRVSDRRGEVAVESGGRLLTRPIPYVHTTRASIHGAVGDLVECLATGRALASPAVEARHVLAVILAALESQARGHVPVACR